jgi:hypothetical protein
MTALVTDNPALAKEIAAAGVPVFDLGDGACGVADLIVERFLGDPASGSPQRTASEGPAPGASSDGAADGD